MRNALLFLSLVGLLLSPAWPQDTTGNLEGRVTDPEGQPLAGTMVNISSPILQGDRETITDEQGNFRFVALPVGRYTVRIAHPAYQEKVLEDVFIRLGRTSSLCIITLSGRREMVHEIVVVADRPIIDTSSTTMGASLPSSYYEHLPLQRNYRNLATLLPQANQSFLGDEANFAGATGLENKYFIDGTEVTDPFRGITGTHLPYNFVKEIEIRAGGYQAEYRSSLGGIVNVVTHSGGNEFRGQVFGFFVNNRFSEEPRQGALEPAKGDFAQYDLGLSLGGPILRDRVWFFAAYNPNFEREEVNIPGCGFFTDRKTTHIFASKLSWRVNPKNSLVFTIFGDPAERNGVGETFGAFGMPFAFANPDPYLEDIGTGGVNISLIGNHFISENIFIETTLSRIKQKYENLPATERGGEEYLFIDAESGIWSGGVGLWSDSRSAQLSFGVKGTILFNSHTAKAGFEYRDNRLTIDERGEALWRYGPDNYFKWESEKTAKEVHNRIPSFFIQDSWKISGRLQLNPGLRWDGQYWVGSDRKVAQKVLGQFQPRIGFIYQPGKLGSQKVFGSFGRFFQELSTWPILAAFAEGVITRFLYYDQDPRIDPSGAAGVDIVSTIAAEIQGLKGQYYDQFTMGYERRLSSRFKLGISGIYRALREGLENAMLPGTGETAFGNPGSGKLTDFPRVKRRYTALEFTLQKMDAGKFNFFASYVLSRNIGNYTGLFNSDFNYPFPNSNGSFDILETLTDGTGLLPNDRTHVFKFSGFYRWGFGLTLGTWLIWQSGTPLNEFGGSSFGPPFYIFLEQRGTAGRTPSVFDLNFRLTYDLARLMRTKWQPKLILDIFHLGSRRRPVNFEQVRYFNQDLEGQQINPNPIYGLATRYHAPMSARLGMEVDF